MAAVPAEYFAGNPLPHGSARPDASGYGAASWDSKTGERGFARPAAIDPGDGAALARPLSLAGRSPAAASKHTAARPQTKAARCPIVTSGQRPRGIPNLAPA